MDNFILDEKGNPVPEPDLTKWGRWMGKPNVRIVAKDTIGDSEVSTVFLGMDHSYMGGIPILWETMIFGGDLDGEMDRYTSLGGAKKGHKKMCELVKEND